jgi:2-isopropylmalate synthase
VKKDGTQGESVSASVDDKLKIVSRLCKFGVDYIEAGWPGSNPKDAEFFHRSKSELSQLEQSKLVAFGSTCRKNTLPNDDNQVDALINSNAPTICIVAKSHLWQVTDILQTTGDENLRMIYDTVQYLTTEHNRTVMIDLEHFFDGYKANPEYALRCCENAVDAGVSCLVLCDTNGGTMPWDVATICQSIVQHFDYHVTVGIHCHNDCGMAVANSLVAAQNGVGLIQGTINGIGERTGNADLCSIVPSLAFHLNKQQQSNNDNDESLNEVQSGSQMTCRENIPDITSLSRYVDEILNRTPNAAAPYVGSSAFAHKGGLHVAAMERSSASYQHIDPEQVGNKKRVLVSELSGRHNILGKMKEHVDVFDNVDEAELSVRAMAILKHVKKLEAAGYTFEGADASVHLMILHSTRGYCPPFQVLDYTTNVYDSNIDSATRVLYKQQQPESESRNGSSNPVHAGAQARATVKVRTFTPPEYDINQNVDETQQLYYTDVLEVSDGNGPVDALGKALKRALVPSYPYVQGIELIDYKVRILDPESATMAATRVMIEFRDTNTDNTWTTVSVDTNLISASLNALLDGFEYALIEHVESCNLCDDFF